MKCLRASAAAAAALALVALLAPAKGANAFQSPGKSGCKGTAKKKDRAGHPAVWTVYRWPDKSSEVVTTVSGNDPAFWVYRDYQSKDFYLVSVCARDAGAKCTKDDNTDDDLGNDPKVGFMIKGAVDTLNPCHKHDPPLPDEHRTAAGKKFKPGEMFRVSANELYLRSVESGNEGHPYGLLRSGDRFVREKVSADRKWMWGWAHTSCRGVNPKMRYGKVPYAGGRYLKKE